MNNIFINLKEIQYYGFIKDYFDSKDVVSIEELMDALEEVISDLEFEKEKYNDLKNKYENYEDEKEDLKALNSQYEIDRI